MAKYKLFLTGILIALVTIGADQAVKFQMMDYLLNPNPHNVIITSFFNLIPVWNKGISFGFLKADSYLQLVALIGASLLLVALLLVWLYRMTRLWQTIGCGFVIGGAMGNIVDRFIFGAVFDFLDFHLFGYHWPAFNVADSAIVVGIVFILYDGLRKS